MPIVVDSAPDVFPFANPGSSPHGEGRAVVNVRTLYGDRENKIVLQDITELAGIDVAGRHFTRRSDDHGRTWSSMELLFEPREMEGGGYGRMGESALVLSNLSGRIYRFHNDHHYPEKHFTSAAWWNCRLFVSVSKDQGLSFENALPMTTLDCREHEWAPGVVYGKNCLAISFCQPFCRSDGAIILPVQRVPLIESEQRPIIRWQAGCLIGHEKNEEDIQWTSGEYCGISPEFSVRGLCEPAICQLKSGRMIMVMRGSNMGAPSMPGYKWISLSDDGGGTWLPARPFELSTGLPFFSPATGSTFLRHSNGKIYWIGNRCEENPNGGRPRFPLVIGELDEERLVLLESSISLIDTRTENDSPYLQLSNFRVYEEAESGNIVLNLARLEANGKAQFASPSHRYRIKV